MSWACILVCDGIAHDVPTLLACPRASERRKALLGTLLWAAIILLAGLGTAGSASADSYKQGTRRVRSIPNICLASPKAATSGERAKQKSRPIRPVLSAGSAARTTTPRRQRGTESSAVLGDLRTKGSRSLRRSRSSWCPPAGVIYGHRRAPPHHNGPELGTSSHRKLIEDFATKNRIILVGVPSWLMEVGALLTYGPNVADIHPRPRPKWTKFSKVRSLPTCRCNSRLRSNSTSTSRPPRGSASLCRRQSSRAPTR
jgi:hypothetical protein